MTRKAMLHDVLVRKLYDSIEFTVPLIPPSANHYVKHTRNGRHYVTAEAIAFKQAVALYAKNRQVRHPWYSIEITLHLAAKQKLDIDNCAKVILDGLVQAEIIDSDAKVTMLRLVKKRCPENPRTCIAIWPGAQP